MGASSIGKKNDTLYTISWHDQVGIEGALQSVVFFICDDCGEAYLEPRYYTFSQDNCVSGNDPHNCTENICPDCAGPYLTPDDENDPRRPAV